MSEVPGWEPVNYKPPEGPYGSAPLLVKLAAIFNLVMAGLDVIYGLLLAALVVLIIAMGHAPAGASAGPELFPGRPGEEMKPEDVKIASAVYGVMAFMSLGVAVVKLIGGIKLLRHSRGAWGWGLTAGIVGCVQLWCSLFCVLPLAVGIYTIVAMSMESVRRFLADPDAR